MLKKSRSSAIVQFIFFGNYFYGLCAAALTVEATLQQQFPLNSAWYFIAVFSATVLYYTKAYITESSPDPGNLRAVWYAENRKTVIRSQLFFTFLLAALCIAFLANYYEALKKTTVAEWFVLLVFPVTAAFYYGINSRAFHRFKLRNIGWLKPFVIGFTWAGLVTVYPVLYYSVIHQLPYEITFVGFLLFLKNFMFVTVLCIMFDIKDYAMDHNRQLKTFVVRAGLRNTIFYIILPLCLLGLGSFIYFGISRHFHPVKISLNVIPFLLLMLVAYSLHTRKSILYYLIIIDGMMLVKAVCGSIAMTWF